MKYLALLFLALCLSGCGAVRSVVGLEEYQAEDGSIKVRSAPGGNLADIAAGLLNTLGPWGILAGTGLGIAKRVIRHREVLAHGQKDDNFDGIPDDEQQPAVAVSPAPPSTTTTSSGGA